MFWFLIILMPEENIQHNNGKDKMLSITSEAINAFWLDVLLKPLN